MGRLDAGDGILNHETFGSRYRRLPVEQGQRVQISLRIRLSVLDVLRGRDVLELLSDSGGLQTKFNFMPERSGNDRKPIVATGHGHEIRDAGIDAEIGLQ